MRASTAVASSEMASEVASSAAEITLTAPGILSTALAVRLPVTMTVLSRVGALASGVPACCASAGVAQCIISRATAAAMGFSLLVSIFMVIFLSI